MRKLIAFVTLMVLTIYNLEAKHVGRSPGKFNHDGDNILTATGHHSKLHKASHPHGHNTANEIKDDKRHHHKHRKAHDRNRQHHSAHKHKRGADYYESIPDLDYEYVEYQPEYYQPYEPPTYYAPPPPCPQETASYKPSEVTIPTSTTTTTTAPSTTRKPFYQYWEATKITTTTQQPKIYYPKPIKPPVKPLPDWKTTTTTTTTTTTPTPYTTQLYLQYNITNTTPVPTIIPNPYIVDHVEHEIKNPHQNFHDELVQRHKDRLAHLAETINNVRDKTAHGVKSIIDHLLPSKHTGFPNGCGCEQQILQLEQSMLLLEEELLKVKSFLAAREASISDGKTKIVKIVKKPKTTADDQLIVA
ncbi:uncharacterized protein LOC129779954 [Toxorhynchites rutilus septentrionalis]|uniref:uncharacterized protein LOC129779954 n=1 Tax=Toxorhynchites rutilus septentrionalis TaxID=329112 RepID=UPI002479682A|nr:uncharacterized protein LOC129779954 [Toxorhynchites rutilus septentrionalis]